MFIARILPFTFVPGADEKIGRLRLKMEVESRPSSSQADQNESTADRRKSGRASKKPELYSQTYNDGDAVGGEKRKRTNGDDDEEDEDMSESESDEADDEPDEEELRERKRAARRTLTKKSSGSKSKPKPRSSHSAKKVKVGNGAGGQLAYRPANGKRTVSRPKKPKVRPSLAAGETGLYGMFLVLRPLDLTDNSSGGLWEEQ